MMRIFMTDLKQGLCSGRFLVSCAILLALMLSAQGVPSGYDIPNYSIFMTIFKTNSSLWEQEYFFSSFHMWEKGITVNHFGAFLPAIAALPSLPLLCDEYKSQNYRFHCIRSSRLSYILSKGFAVMGVACCAVFFSLSVFGLICAMVFPPLTSYQTLAIVLESGLDVSIPWLIILQYTLFLMAFSACGAMLCMLFAAMTMDKFSSLTLPVVICFLFNQLSQKLYVREHDIRFYFLSPDQQYRPFQWLPQLFPDCSVWLILLLPLAGILLFLLSAIFIIQRRLHQ